MKNAKKLLCLLLICAMTFTLFVACKKDEEGTPPPEQPTTTEINLSEYTMIRSTKNGSDVTDSATDLADAVTKALGTKFTLKRDMDVEANADAKEILIGQTNRDESTQALTDLGDKFAYSIRVTGNKITVMGSTNELIVKALAYMQENWLANLKDGKVQIPNEYTAELEYHELVKDGKTDYELIYSEADGGTENFSSVDTIRKTFDSYLSDSGIEFGTGTYKNEQDLAKKAILVGNTNFPHSQELAKQMGIFSWAMESKGDQIYLCAFETNALKSMGNKIKERIENGIVLSTATAEKKTVRICKIDRVAGGNEKWNTAVPLYTGGTPDAFLQIDQGFYRMRYTKTDRATFDAYAATLAADGFELYASNSMDSNVFNTYYKDDLMLHAYYLHNTKSVSLVMASASSAPKYALQAYSDGTNVATPNLVLTDMNYRNQDGSFAHNNGMGFIFTMSDGSYVVVDGGHSNDAPDLYEFMKNNNTRTDGKILIRAWILTHPDGDHYGALVNFANSYGPKDASRPEVILENYVTQYHYNSYRSGSITGTVDRITNALKNFGSYTRIVPLLGQTMYFGEAAFTFLGTAELPQVLTLGNNEQSLIMNVAFKDKKILMMGDAMGAMATASNQVFTEAFRANFYQAAHHGLNPCQIDNKSQATDGLILCTHKVAAETRKDGFLGLLNRGNPVIVADDGYKTIIP